MEGSLGRSIFPRLRIACTRRTLFLWELFRRWSAMDWFPLSLMFLFSWPSSFQQAQPPCFGMCVGHGQLVCRFSRFLFAGDSIPFPTLYYSAWTGNSITCASSNIFYCRSNHTERTNCTDGRLDTMDTPLPPFPLISHPPFRKQTLAGGASCFFSKGDSNCYKQATFGLVTARG
jgi:hypothetical protein